MMMINNSNSYKRGVTGFHPKLKSFVSCSHMNCCLHYILHINLHILYIYFVKLNLNLKEFKNPTSTSKVTKETRLIFYALYIQIEIAFEFEYQIRFSRQFMIQYMTTLLTCECNQILFHITPCHDGSHCEK